MIDLHSHVLPGLDDGAKDLEAAVGMVRSAAADGIKVLAATPHVRDDYPTTPEQMETALSDLREAAGGLGVELLAGGELALDMIGRLDAETLARFGLGGNPNYLLVETPYYGWRIDLPQILFELRARGITPVLAHPERNGSVQADPSLLEPVVAGGTLIQLTAASVDGRLGRRPRETARTLLERGLAHMLASDSHAPSVRAIGMSEARSAIGDEALARWLTEEAPRALLDGVPLPERPQSPRRRRRFGIF